ncbi:hypothetical protein MTP99_018337 [Tenebrio molitor]|jgi:hypothetical protein|nr:hypothetical protein MTP99_018337 [Tenebrio molitor]
MALTGTDPIQEFFRGDRKYPRDGSINGAEFENRFPQVKVAQVRAPLTVDPRSSCNFHEQKEKGKLVGANFTRGKLHKKFSMER